MSAEIIPLPTPNQSAPSNISPMPSPPAAAAAEEDRLSKLLKNPLVLAGGALLAGVALSRLLSTSPMRKLAKDIADEALKRARNSGEPAAAPTLLEEGLEALRPQVTQAAKEFLNEILKKP